MKKSCQNKEILKRLVAYLKPYKVELIIVGILLIVSTAIGILQPLVIQKITDEGMVQKDMFVVAEAAFTLVILVLVNQSIDLLQTRIFANIHNASYFDIFHQTFEKLLHLKKSYFDDKNCTEVLSNLQTDVSRVSSITERYVIMCGSYAFRIISGMIGLSIISWKLVLVVLALVPIKFFLVRFLSARQEKAIDEIIMKDQSLSRWFGDSIEGIDEIKLWNLFQKRDKEFQDRQEKLLRQKKKSAMLNGWNSFWEQLLEWSVTILLYVLGGFLVCTGSLSIGAVFAFVSYSSYVTGPVSAFINLKMFFAQIYPSAKRLFKFLDTETEQDTGYVSIKHFPPKLEFQNVSFSYVENCSVLHGASFYVAPGEKIAIIGPNGSGKSTILNLLLRFYEPESGRILADGTEVQKIPLEEYRSMFSVVSQAPYLFLGNVLENVDLSGTANEDMLEKALQVSGVNEYLPKMPQKGKTQIGRNGARLSGGEKQKLAVARAILKDAPVVILDEATSGFDVESDAYLHDVILHEMKEKSVIMITHRYENLEGMDRVYRIENGVLREISV